MRSIKSYTKGALSVAAIAFLAFSCQNKPVEEKKEIGSERIESYITGLGKEYPIPQPGEKTLEQFEVAKLEFEKNPDDVEAIIWYGRRTAYLGQHPAAIEIYSYGIEKFPKEPRLYRHRGHRYISIREYDKAITDLEKASELIQGTENEVEPDGMPNAMNIPVSTLHGNIYYHLGLAYYLTHQYDKALETYIKCRESGSRYDNIVSSTHWLYMIQQRLGDPQAALAMLSPITSDSTVIENQSYADLCLMYKDLLPVDSLLSDGPGNPSNDAVQYGVSNWYLYNQDTAKAKELMMKLLDSKSFTSFGYLAAESDILEYFGGN